MKHPLDSFIEFLQKKDPNVCVACFGQGEVEFRGMYVRCPIKCPECKGTGRKKMMIHIAVEVPDEAVDRIVTDYVMRLVSDKIRADQKLGPETEVVRGADPAMCPTA